MQTSYMGAMVLGRFSATAALAASLVLSMLPLAVAPVGAAPPETLREAATASSGDAVADANAESASPATMPQYASAPLSDATEQLGEDGAPGARTDAHSDSVRPRGLEAPVQLKQQEGQGAAHRQEPEAPEENENADKPKAEARDPGDGPVRKREQASKTRDRAPQEIRVWPMPAESYTFTQQFGCVQQLGNLYFPGEGCPAEAPVIHTGIDLAAPEGTLFYAAASGWVTLAGFDRPTADANTRIIIQHDGRNDRYATDYLHWIASYVEEGDYVRAGDPIGEIGSVGYSTGPHLHFSVTDLDTGEHVDPLRWLPDEPGLEGYVSRRPSARLRLPSGTTAGQPESADPAPPPPPSRKNVPESPPGDAGARRDRSERRDERKRDERRAEKRDDSAGKNPDRSGKKRSGEERDAAADSDEPAGETTKERDRSRERERSRERNKDGSKSEESDSGDDGRNRDNRDDARDGNQRRDRDAGNDAGGGGKQKRGEDSDERDRRDDSGRGDSGGRDERGGGGSKDRGKGAKSEDEAVAAVSTADDSTNGGEDAALDGGSSGDDAPTERGIHERREKT